MGDRGSDTTEVDCVKDEAAGKAKSAERSCGGRAGRPTGSPRRQRRRARDHLVLIGNVAESARRIGAFSPDLPTFLGVAPMIPFATNLLVETATGSASGFRRAVV